MPTLESWCPRGLRQAATTLLLLTLAACGDSPTVTTPPPVNPSPGVNVTGAVVDGVSNQPVAGATILIGGLGQATSAPDGSFGLRTTESPATRAVTITSPSTIDRATWAFVSGTVMTLPLMPSSLGLTAFDQMFRGSGGALHRWTTAPRIVIQRRVLQFTNVTDTAYVATASVMSDPDVEALLADLTWALPQLTGSTFSAFADPQVEMAAENDRVAVSRTGIVVVARYQGLTSASTFWGYTRWAWNGAGEMQAGIVMLDQGFETSGSPFRRSLRAHELGHALGYNHVTATASVMSSAARTEPNDFDRGGSRIAFLRPVLNRSPDADPAPSAIPAGGPGTLVWSESP